MNHNKAKYRTIFVEKNDIGAYHWIKIRSLKKSAIFKRQRNNITAEYIHRMQALYRHLKKIKTTSTRQLFAKNVPTSAIYSMKLFFWMLAKYSKNANQGDTADGLIVNSASITETLAMLSKDVSSPLSSFKQSLVKFIRYTLPLLPTLVILITTALFIKLNSQLFSGNVETINNKNFSQILSQWISPANHICSSYTAHIENINLTSSQEISTLSSFMVLTSLFGLAIAMCLLLAQFLYYRYNADENPIKRACIEELPIYKQIMCKLAESATPLDETSKELLQARGISSQEMEGYRIYSNATLITAEMADLFEQLALGSFKDAKMTTNFRKALALGLDSSSDEQLQIA